HVSPAQPEGPAWLEDDEHPAGAIRPRHAHATRASHRAPRLGPRELEAELVAELGERIMADSFRGVYTRVCGRVGGERHPAGTRPVDSRDGRPARGSLGDVRGAAVVLVVIGACAGPGQATPAP